MSFLRRDFDMSQIMRKLPSLMSALACLMVAGVVDVRAEAAAKSDKTVPVDLYVMSQCPWGVRAEDVLIPAAKSLAPHVDLRLLYIADAKPDPSGAAGKMQFASMHGDPEVQENLRQVCAKQHFPSQHLDYVLARNKAISDPNWQQAATAAGIAPQTIETCATGPEGAALLAENLKAHTARNANASPTIDLDGKPYNGARGIRSVTLALCDALQAKGVARPQACKDAEALPPDPVPTASGCGAPAAPMAGGGCGGAAAGGCGGGAAQAQAAPVTEWTGISAAQAAAFPIRVVADQTCPVCQPQLVPQITRIFPSATIVTVSADSDEGRALIQSHHATTLPLYVLDRQVEQAGNFAQAQRVLLKSGDGYAIRPDLAAPDVQLDRPRVPHHLDLFVNSTAPITPWAEAQLMRFFQRTASTDLTFSIHFIALEGAGEAGAKSPSGGAVRAANLAELNTVHDGPLISAGGEAETRESLQQLCLFQHASMGDFFAYLTCRNRGLQDTKLGERCVAASKALTRCVDGGEGAQLLRHDARLARALGITVGPMLLWENRYGPFRFDEIAPLDRLVAPAAAAGSPAPANEPSTKPSP